MAHSEAKINIVLTRLTGAASLFTSNIPTTLNSRAVHSRAGRSTSTTRGEVGGGVEALVVPVETGQATDHAGLHVVRAEFVSARFELAFVPVVATGLGRRRRRRDGGGFGRLAASGGIVVPFPFAGALGRGVLLRGLLGNAALLARVPFPAARRALLATLRRRRRVALATVRKTTVLVRVAATRKHVSTFALRPTAKY